jgi:transposase
LNKNKKNKNTQELYKHIPSQFQPEFVSLHNQNVALLEKVNSLNRTIFGSKAERHVVPPYINPAEPLFNDAESVLEKDEQENVQNQDPMDDKTPDPKPKKRNRSPDSGGRNPLPENLRRVDIICDIPEEDKICPVDGAQLKLIGEEIVEKLELIPSEIIVNRYVYKKYACPECDNTIEKAPAVQAALGTSACDVGLLTFILMQKYLNAMPLYRLEQHFAQCDVEISRTSMARWVVLAADFIGDIAHEIKKFILSQKSLHADETTVQVLKEPGKTPQSKSYMWLLCSPENTHPAVWLSLIHI